LGLLYGLPTIFEFEVVRYLGPWACVIVGDLCGCAFLFYLGLKRLSVGLYVLTTLAEAALLSGHLLSPQALPWLTDLLPAITAGGVAGYAMIVGMMNS
jgi:hypothetical protein